MSERHAECKSNCTCQSRIHKGKSCHRPLPSNRTEMRKPCSYSLLFFPKGKGDAAVIYMRCKNWDCPRCRPGRIKRWIDHVARVLRQGQRRFKRIEMAEELWEAFRQRLFRSKAKYIRVRMNAKTVVVYYTDKDGELDTETTIIRFAKDLRSSTWLAKSVTISRPWGFDDETEGMEGDFRRPIVIDPEAAIEAAKKYDIAIVHSKNLDRIDVLTSKYDPYIVGKWYDLVLELTRNRQYSFTARTNNTFTLMASSSVINTRCNTTASVQPPQVDRWAPY